MGAGTVHPVIVQRSGIDADCYSDFAFGAWTRACRHSNYGSNHIRDSTKGDVRFSEQFKWLEK